MLVALWIYGLAHVGVLTGPPAVINAVAFVATVNIPIVILKDEDDTAEEAD